MSKKTIIVLLLTFAVILTTQAQVRSFNIGITPAIGMDNINIKHWQQESESFEREYKMHYNTITGINAQFETVFDNSVFILGELSYSSAKFDEYEVEDGNTLPLIPNMMDDINVYSAGAMIGIRNGARIQFPIGIGPSVDYVSGTPFKHLFLSLNAEVRIKFYLTRVIAVYGGIRGKAGYSFGNTGDHNMRKKKNDEKSSEGTTYLFNMDLHFFRAMAYPQIGITFTLGGE